MAGFGYGADDGRDRAALLRCARLRWWLTTAVLLAMLSPPSLVYAASYQKTDGSIVDPILDVWGNDHPYAGPNLMPGASLVGADLGGAIVLIEADLAGADLSSANLVSARLNDADLTDANLDGAVLPAAHLLGTTLENVDLSNTDLNYVVSGGIQGSNLELGLPDL